MELGRREAFLLCMGLSLSLRMKLEKSVTTLLCQNAAQVQILGEVRQAVGGIKQ